MPTTEPSGRIGGGNGLPHYSLADPQPLADPGNAVISGGDLRGIDPGINPSSRKALGHRLQL